MGLESVGTPVLWISFTLLVLVMLGLDLGVFHRRVHEVGVREALLWTMVWISLALVFNVAVYFWFGSERALEFLTGYLIEKALSVDNIFVFLVLFAYFAVPPALQHRVLFWGIVGALVMRAIFILLGAALLQSFHWVIYIFGGFLVLTGVKLLLQRGSELHPERNPLFRQFRRLLPAVGDFRGSRFTVVENGKRYATPLLLVLLAIEATDIVFAVDSIPAVFAVTNDPFIVYTSNIFAILGLRALYFLLADMHARFSYLQQGLAIILAFVGIKMIIHDWYHIPTWLSLLVIALVLVASVGFSLRSTAGADTISISEPLPPPDER
jgi:tellurite resistance protein TerC